MEVLQVSWSWSLCELVLIICVAFSLFIGGWHLNFFSSCFQFMFVPVRTSFQVSCVSFLSLSLLCEVYMFRVGVGVRLLPVLF